MQQTSKIDLKGKLEDRGSGFRSGTDPVVVELQGGNTLLVLFQKDVGMLQVAVIGPQGQVYTAEVNTGTSSALTIPLAGLPAGNYSVSFSGEAGMMWGEFEV